MSLIEIRNAHGVQFSCSFHIAEPCPRRWLLNWSNTAK